MKEFVDKLIGRFRDCTTIEDYGELFVSLDEVENIIYEFAEEYKPTTNSNIQEVIDNLEVYTVGRLKNARVRITVEELQNQIDRLEQLAEEYNNSNDSMEIQIAKNYAKWLTKCGVNVTEKWLTATEQTYALNKAYMRGRQDEIDKFARWQDEHKDNVMIDGQYCWQTCVCTDRCNECNRLADGEFDYYESIGEWEEEYINTSTDISTDTSSGWIPCSERLPRLDEYVLCFINDEYAKHNIIISKFDDEIYWHNGRITAWMPLPQPYTEEQKELSTTWQQQTMNRFERID